MNVVAENKMFGGAQRVYEHVSESCAGSMRLGVFLPPQVLANTALKVPALFWLSGLTCTEQNFVTKAAAQKVAAELGIILIAPDTSPRGEGVADDPEGAYDFGLGAGFYLNATQSPFAKHYQMYQYIAEELPALLVSELPIDREKMGVFGHSMGGHGALTIHLKNPQRFKTVSAFAPIVAPMQVPWGQKAFAGYLGDDESTWRQYDSCELIRQSASGAHMLVDFGGADEFLAEQLKPELLEQACSEAGQTLTMNLYEGYDHSYYFMASFMNEHIRHHYAGLNG